MTTGKTPEFFIKWVQRILREWDTQEIQKEVKAHNMDCSVLTKVDTFG